MLSFIGGLVVIVVLVYLGLGIYSSCLKKRVSAPISENKLIKRFNKTLKKLTERNLDQVKEELLEILREYREIKCEEFTDSVILLKNSIKSINSQIDVVLAQESNIIKNIKKLKQSPSDTGSEKIGAMYVYELEKLGNVKTKLNACLSSLETKLESIEQNIALFEHRYSMKQSEIAIMIAEAIAIKDISMVDLKINDLITEFKTKAEENEIAIDVRKKVYKTDSFVSTDDENNYNTEEYLEKFKNFSE